MPKNHLTLYIDNDLTTLAKASGLNLSHEFEEWVRIRLGQTNINNQQMDIPLEIAKHKAEIQRLENQAEISKQEEYVEQEETQVIDGVIDNEMQNMSDEKLEDIPINRSHGLVFLFNKRFNKVINSLDAKELMERRMKERGLIK